MLQGIRLPGERRGGDEGRGAKLPPLQSIGEVACQGSLEGQGHIAGQRGDKGGRGHVQAFLAEARGCAKAQGQEDKKTQALQRFCF